MDNTNTSTDIKGFPSYSEITDATRNSLICIVVSLFIIAVTWRSYPCCCSSEIPFSEAETDEEKEKQDDLKAEGMVPTVPFKVNFSWPFKILTVLFHEMSHAIVGMITGGRVGYISVNAREGGSTYFKPDPKHQPWLRTTLAAGYLGSCLIGCALLAAGFDALASKKAALVLLSYLGITIIICGIIRPEIGYRRAWLRISCYAQRWLGCGQARRDPMRKLRIYDNKKAEEALLFAQKQAQAHVLSEKIGAGTAELEVIKKGQQSKEDRTERKLLVKQLHKDEEELAQLEIELISGYKDKMVTVDLIAGIALIICALIIPAWLVADSVALRFVVMFIGLFSAVYAVQDVYDDGVKNYQAQGSDANVYAGLMIPAPEGIDWNEVAKGNKTREVEEWELRLDSRTKHLAWISLIVQLFAILITIVAAVYFVRTTTAQQALESRAFLPTPFHLRSADMLEKTQNGAEEALKWGKDKLGEFMEGDEER